MERANPVEPPDPGWSFPDPGDAMPGQEVIAVGADLSPGALLAGYRRGMFAMNDDNALLWWSPDPRGIMTPDEVHISGSMRRALGLFTVSLDHDFEAVLRGCADPAREHGWITAAYQASYRRLHAMGWAHSIEVWSHSGRLAGGLMGVQIGGFFAGESMFHDAQCGTNASKVAVIALAELLGGSPPRMIDVQWSTPHLATLGVQEVPRMQYLAMLAAALALPPVLRAGIHGTGARGIRWR